MPRVLSGAGVLEAERVALLSPRPLMVTSGFSPQAFRPSVCRGCLPYPQESLEARPGETQHDCGPPACNSATVEKYSGPARLPTRGFTASPLLGATVMPGCAGQVGLLVRAHPGLKGQPGGFPPAFSGGLGHNAGGWVLGHLLPCTGTCLALRGLRCHCRHLLEKWVEFQ